MDLSFLLRAERMLDRRPHGGIDYDLLVAALSAHQAAGASGPRASGGSGEVRAWQGAQGPLVELLSAGAAWREARRAQRGMFNRALARNAASTRRKEASPPRLPSHFRVPSRLAPYNPDIEAALPVGPRTF
jgi:hypothetical protein